MNSIGSGLSYLEQNERILANLIHNINEKYFDSFRKTGGVREVLDPEEHMLRFWGMQVVLDELGRALMFI